MYVSFDIDLLGAKGVSNGQKLGDLLSDLLLTETKGNTRKLYGWGLLLAHGKEIFLDDADKKLLTDLVDGTERLIVLVKAQILNILDGINQDTKGSAA